MDDYERQEQFVNKLFMAYSHHDELKEAEEAL
jgi:hypothetical protein